MSDSFDDAPLWSEREREQAAEIDRLTALLGETNDALAACQSEGAAWKRLAEERAWKIDAHEYVLSQRGEKTLYWAAVAVANAIQIGAGGMIRGTAMEEDLRNALMLQKGELRNVPKGSTVRTTATVDSAPTCKVLGKDCAAKEGLQGEWHCPVCNHSWFQET